MSSAVKTTEKKVKPSSEQAMELIEVAEKLRDDAIDYVLSRLPPVKQDQNLEEILQQRDCLCAFKYGLAEGVSTVIGDFDDTAVESFFFEPSTNPDAELVGEIFIDGTINIILLVKSKSAGLEAFIASLDRAMTQALKKLSLPILKTYDSVLNVIPVTEEDIEERKGYATLLSSIHAPALKLWQRA